MKVKLILSAAVLGLAQYCWADPPPPMPAVPPPVVTTTVSYPTTYVWDGNEYVGVVGTQYYYLGSGNVWMTMSPSQQKKFDKWEAKHSDWRSHATRNTRYHNMQKNEPQPMKYHPVAPDNQPIEPTVTPGQYGPQH